MKLMGKVEVYDCIALKETDGALLVSVCNDEKEVWVPKSQIHDESEVYKEGTDGTLIISEWAANQAELEE